MPHPQVPPVLLILALTLLYALVPASVFRGDALAYAQDLESPGPRLVNPNHLLYGVVGYGALEACHLFGRNPEPIRVLQVLGVLTAAACLWTFHSLLRALDLEARSARGFVLCLGLTSGFWLQAISPETFSLSMFLVLVVVRLAVRYFDAPSGANAVWAGGACGLAMLGTEVDLLLLPVVLWLVARRAGASRLRHASLVAGALALVAGAGFGLGAAVARIPADGLAAWMLGRASARDWIGFEPLNLLRDLRHLVTTLVPVWNYVGFWPGSGTLWTLAHLALALPCLGVVFALAILALRNVRGLEPRDRTVLAVIAVYLAGLTSFFTFWVNGSDEFWATHWVPIWCLLAIALKPSLRGRGTLAGIRAASILLGLLGLLFLAIPFHDAEEGHVSRNLRDRIGAADLVVVTWYESVAPASGSLLRPTDRAPLRRSTFAINLSAYVRRRVQHAGCWEQEGRPNCYQSAEGEAIAREVEGALAAGHQVWLLDVTGAARSAGFAGPAAVLELRRRFVLREHPAPPRGSAFSEVTLWRIEAHPAMDPSPVGSRGAIREPYPAAAL